MEAVFDNNDPQNSSPLEVFLHALSRIYAVAVKVRLAGYRHGIFKTRRLPCKVISIGNVTAGGTGKTPFAIYVAAMIHRWGLRAAVISRGYKGDAERRGAVVSDGSRLLASPEAAGDEPFLMAVRLMPLSVPVLVGRDRVRIGLQAIQRFAPDVIILDDGFQHVRLARDIDVVLLDSQRPLGNSHLLPRGVLREPLSSLRRADLFVFTRTTAKEKDTGSHPCRTLPFRLPDRPVFRAAHAPVLRVWIQPGQNAALEQLSRPGALEIRQLAGRRVFAFSGIAANAVFQRSLTGLGIDVSGFIGFGDHHAYSTDDLSRILDAARSAGADCLCTTDKDWVKLPRHVDWPLELAVMGVDIDLGGDAPGFAEQLRLRLCPAG
ncbi:MAG: hypothetical protein AMJ54_07640 [Deltaproteobacteria bacterium SG8_13]|nr:MAG: hypothetical protein AMJ54_07640 [Deltaproteobacteria bacterium SG8_13]